MKLSDWNWSNLTSFQEINSKVCRKFTASQFGILSVCVFPFSLPVLWIINYTDFYWHIVISQTYHISHVKMFKRMPKSTAQQTTSILWEIAGSRLQLIFKVLDIIFKQFDLIFSHFTRQASQVHVESSFTISSQLSTWKIKYFHHLKKVGF